MCSSLLGLGGTDVQQCFVCLSPLYLCAAFSCVFKSNLIWKYVFTLLHVLSTPRGPPARKSSHFLTRFAFPCTVVVVRLFRFQHHFSWKHFFFTGSVFCYKLTDSKGYIYWPMLYRTSFCTVWNYYVRFRPPGIFWDYVRSSFCARFTVRPSTSVTYRTR